MDSHIIDTDSGIYRITKEGKIFTQSKLKIPLVGRGMEFTGEFKIILKPEREMKLTLNNRGYLTVIIRKKTYMVHRLVAKHFIQKCKGKNFVNHKDGNKLNNHSDNLEWVTIAENNAHARLTGLHRQAVGYKVVYKSEATKAKCLSNLLDKSKLTDDEVRYVRKVHVARSKEFSSTALASQFGVSVVAMCKIISGKTYTHVK